jgi:hypothetical protein
MNPYSRGAAFAIVSMLIFPLRGSPQWEQESAWVLTKLEHSLHLTRAMGFILLVINKKQNPPAHIGTDGILPASY